MTKQIEKAAPYFNFQLLFLWVLLKVKSSYGQNDISVQAVMKVVFSDVNHGNLTFSVIRRVTMDLIGVTHVIPIPGLLNDLIRQRTTNTNCCRNPLIIKRNLSLNRYIVENRVHLHSLNLLRPLRLCYLANHRLDPSLSSMHWDRARPLL